MASGVYLIISGKVKKYRISGQAKAQIIYVAGQVELVGYNAILFQERYPDSAAKEDCRLAYIPKEDFTEMLYNALFFPYLLKALSYEFTVYSNMLSTLMQHSASERLTIVLIILRKNLRGVCKRMEKLLSAFRGLAEEMLSAYIVILKLKKS